MNKNCWKLFFIIMIATSVITVFIDYRMTTGWLLGCFASALVYKRTESFWNGVVDRGFSTKHTGIGNFTLNYAIMAIVLIISAVLPKFFNIFSCACGLFLIRIVIILDSLRKEKRDDDTV